MKRSQPLTRKSPPKRSPMKRSQPRRDWRWANAKFEAEDGRCRVCGSTWNVERAHVVGREQDFKAPVRQVLPEFEVLRESWSIGPVVHPDRIIPLCGPSTDPTTCHGKQHNKRLDLLPYLTLAEQVQAVADAEGIESARIRLSPSEREAA